LRGNAAALREESPIRAGGFIVMVLQSGGNRIDRNPRSRFRFEDGPRSIPHPTRIEQPRSRFGALTGASLRDRMGCFL